MLSIIPDTNDAIELIFHASNHVMEVLGRWQLVILQFSGNSFYYSNMDLDIV